MLFQLISITYLVSPLFPLCGLDCWNKQKFIAKLMGQAMPCPSFSLPLEAKCLVKELYPSICRRLAFLLRFYLGFESGTMFLSGNFSGLSHCFNHVNKAVALKLWAEPCQLQTAAAQRSQQSTCCAPSISVPTPGPNRLNIGSGCWPWPIIHWGCCLQSSLPSSGPASSPLMQLTSFWAGRDDCADGVSADVQATNQSKCRWECKVYTRPWIQI